MLRFNEDLLQFIWRYRLLKPLPLLTVSGKQIVLVKTGDLNRDSGPDFFNALIQIDGMQLAGNIEIHIKTSDWLKHGHQTDKAYDNIILHAVHEHDVVLPQNTDNNVEVLELRNLIDERTILNYEQLASAPNKLPCSSFIKKVEDIKFTGWMERMTVERLEDKVKRMESLYLSAGKDPGKVLYTFLLRNFGFKVNAIPFELIAKHLPLQLLLKHADQLFQLEALLLGISGLLEDQFENKYIQKLQNEFEFLKNKYSLQPLQKEIFKFSKLRPANFPNLRLAQLAALIQRHPALLTAPQNFIDFAELKHALKIDLEGYWKNHYKLDGKMLDKELTFGESSAENVIINTFSPFFFLYAKITGKSQYQELALDLLNKCQAEANTKTRLFEGKKSLLKSAAVSQGAINLYDHYCSSKQCLRCGIGAAVLRS